MPYGNKSVEVQLMNTIATRVTGLAVLAVLTCVAAVYGAGSDAAQPKQDISSPGLRIEAPGISTEVPGAVTSETLQLLPNGDFEQGPAVWTEFSQQGKDIIMNSGFPGPVSPHSGNWLAWLGGACEDPGPPSTGCEEVSYVEQELDIPENVTNLTFWYWLASQDVCGIDFGWLKVDGVIVEQYDLGTDTDTDDWLLREVDISAYAGQTVTVRFQADTDAELNSNFFVDDVAFDVAGIFSDGFESGDTSAWSDSVP
jgi:hypothetical protein